MNTIFPKQQTTLKIESLENLLKQIAASENILEKLNILEREPLVIEFLQHQPDAKKAIEELDLGQQLAVKSLLAIGQGNLVFKGFDKEKQKAAFSKLADTLDSFEKFYRDIGGVIGYHLLVLRLLVKNSSPCISQELYLHPVGEDLSKKDACLNRYVKTALETLPQIAEVYPVGGAGDRLGLHDEATQKPLPAAELKFGGKSLLEGMLEDIQAKEFLYYKIYQNQITVPVAMMTSLEKDNHERIADLFEKNNWFGRPKSAFYFFTQPQAPVLTSDGNWAVESPMQLLLKPGGHGVIWKLGQEKGVWKQLEDRGCKKILLRQVNNPAAALDDNLLAFAGFGFLYDKVFGFASCERKVNAAEGMDVLVETKTSKGYEYRISNIEYTEFKNKGIEDAPKSPQSPYSIFPANTNLLLVDLKAIEPALKSCPFPHPIINMKQQIEQTDASGKKQLVFAGRLETMMQNLSDSIETFFSERQTSLTPTSLKTFITFNNRHKTISVTKNSFREGTSLLETPEGCFYELLISHLELLNAYCNIKTPAIENEASYLENGPPLTIFYHPALGPPYQIIGQKIKKGTIEKGSELQLEISDIDIENIHLEGSLLVRAENIMGHKNNDGLLVYGPNTGKCTLRNVTIRNEGIDRCKKNIYWKNWIHRKQAFNIYLEGNAEFFAQDICFNGNFSVKVPSGHKMTAKDSGGKVIFSLEPISRASWHWDYSYDKNDAIVLKKIK